MAETDRHRKGSYLLELAAAGELPPAERDAALAGAARETGLEPLADLGRDAAATLARLPAERVAAEVGRRAAAPPGRSWLRWSVFPALAAAVTAVALAAAVLPARPARAPGPDAEGVRMKGLASGLVVHRRTAGGAERLSPGASARAGDLVQLGYVVTAPRYGVIVSLDGAGGVTRHWPLAGPTAAALDPGREVLLPESFRLDAAPAFERFFLVTADRAFDVAGVIEATRALGRRADARDARLPLPAGLAETDVVLSKETR